MNATRRRLRLPLGLWAALGCLTAAAHAAGRSTAVVAPLLFVSDERAGDVAVIDTRSRSVTARIPVGKRPRGLQLSPDGRLLYVALSGSPLAGPGVDEKTLPPPDRRADGIGVIDVATLRLLKTLSSGADPETFAVAADGRTLWVSNEDAMKVSAVDLQSGAVRGSVAVGVEPEGVAVSADGRRVYVACEGTGEVVVIDARSLAVAARIPSRPRPRGVVLSHDGRRGYISNEVGASISVFDTATARIVGSVPLQGVAGADTRPMGLALSTDDRRLYVTTGRGGSLVEIDTAALRVVRNIAAVGQRPWGLAVNPPADIAYTANGPAGDVSVIDLQSGTVKVRIPVGRSPWGVALSR